MTNKTIYISVGENFVDLRIHNPAKAEGVWEIKVLNSTEELFYNKTVYDF